MKWTELLKRVANEPFFSTGLLSAGENTAQVRLQLSRWVKSGRIIKLRNGLYILAEPYRKVTAEPFLIANALKAASYISLQSALGYYGLIPEYVPVVTSVTTKRPEKIETKLGRFEFRHIKKSLFYGYEQTEIAPSRYVFIAKPEKALLDLIYLTANADRREYIKELRLQNIETIDIDLLKGFADKTESLKLQRAAGRIAKLTKKKNEK